MFYIPELLHHDIGRWSESQWLNKVSTPACRPFSVAYWKTSTVPSYEVPMASNIPDYVNKLWRAFFFKRCYLPLYPNVLYYCESCDDEPREVPRRVSRRRAENRLPPITVLRPLGYVSVILFSRRPSDLLQKEVFFQPPVTKGVYIYSFVPLMILLNTHTKNSNNQCARVKHCVFS